MKRSFKVVVAVLGFGPLGAACGGGTPPTMQGRSGMLSETAIAKQCEAAAKGHDRPFIVEWDATDLASFEAFAARDTVVVKYEGCDIQVLDHCSDPGVPAALGAYGLPQFTSGTVQGFDIGNQGELYAKLPLGAASFSGKVEAGESLHLKYFVSGVATDSRDTLYSADLAKYPGCAGATHFVWGYNLGAFELNSSEHNAESAQAGFGNIGGGGSHGHQQASLANGGSLDSCTTNDQRSCRVPIRLVLRPIVAGSNPSGQSGQTIVVGGQKMTTGQLSDPSFVANTPANQANRMIDEARKRSEQGDGKACVDLLDKAVGISPDRAADTRRQHAMCVMQSGNCDQGKTEMRGVLIKNDPNRTLTDSMLSDQVDAIANTSCPSSTASTSSDYLTRAAHEMTAAHQAKNGNRCKELATRIEAKLDATTKPTTKDLVAQGPAHMALFEASQCIAETGSCKDAEEIWHRDYARKLKNANTPQATIDKVSHDSWETMKQQGQIQCH
ncbi:MAG: hypothetical protein ABI551_24405 [Polyangiaceae bacterium]